jgi:hypothetical protein
MVLLEWPKVLLFPVCMRCSMMSSVGGCMPSVPGYVAAGCGGKRPVATSDAAGDKDAKLPLTVECHSGVHLGAASKLLSSCQETRRRNAVHNENFA